MNRSLSKNLYGPALVLPAFLLVFVILFLPTVNTIIMSLTDFSFLKGSSSQFIGFSNYASVFRNEEFLASLGNTFLFTSVTVSLELFFGILLALVINRSFAFRDIMRTTILFPWMLPTALNAIVWRWLYNTDFGFFNNLLKSLGLVKEGINWLGKIPLTMYSMMGVAIWKTSSFMALILLMGLQTIPTELYQAARIDGAGPFQSFRKIT
ncbi:Diacetylchitobiose uptake system permease protein NgcF [subsurface metagenome]